MFLKGDARVRWPLVYRRVSVARGTVAVSLGTEFGENVSGVEEHVTCPDVKLRGGRGSPDGNASFIA